MTIRRALFAMLAFVLFATVAASAQAPALPADVTKPYYSHANADGTIVQLWRVHVVRGTPTKTAYTGEWVGIHADLSGLPKGATFSHWLVRKDVKVKNLNDPDTLMLMPDRHCDVGWTWFVPTPLVPLQRAPKPKP